VAPEHQETANKTLQAHCKRLTNQQFYNQGHTARSQYNMAKSGKPLPKHENVKSRSTMSAEQYDEVSKLSMRLYVNAKLQLHHLFFTCVLIFQVRPDWAYGKEEAWRALTARWRGEDEEWNALSERNKANRGSGGTHRAGNLGSERYKAKLVYTYMEQPAFISPHACSYLVLIKSLWRCRRIN
jgi:hypothetical protein